jgi:hypothetical protein
LYFGFSIGFSCQADTYQYQHSSKPLTLYATDSFSMTFEEFRKATQRRNSFDTYWHYGIAILFGLFCLFGLFYVTFIDTAKFRSVSYILYPSLLLILVMALSAFFLLPNRYKIVEVPSSLSVGQKSKLAQSLLHNYCGLSNEVASQYIVSELKRRWWQSKYTLHFFYDESRFAFSLQGHDHNGGWIDFGETERRRRDLKKAINELVSH